MAVFLFGVDWLWSRLLQFIGVLKFGGGGGFGSSRLSPTAVSRPPAAASHRIPREDRARYVPPRQAPCAGFSLFASSFPPRGFA